MLQQTQVPTALPYYERFLKRFPTVCTLARASEQAVLKAWQGLGYYRRALNLHEAAGRVVRDHGGRVPDDPQALARLPGVGRYTCGAVLSIAFGRRIAALDANAIRVIARWLAVREATDTGATRAGLWRAAETLVPDKTPGDWNQA
ncbi:MAG: A/G-specific adenine glycosylase, partial [Phycisphaerae bacterium]